MDASLDDSVLPLSERLLEIVEIEDVRIADDLLDGVHPDIFLQLY